MCSGASPYYDLVDLLTGGDFSGLPGRLASVLAYREGVTGKDTQLHLRTEHYELSFEKCYLMSADDCC
jgi:hypothetical protein